jgi:hypothetical protein
VYGEAKGECGANHLAATNGEVGDFRLNSRNLDTGDASIASNSLLFCGVDLGVVVSLLLPRGDAWVLSDGVIDTSIVEEIAVGTKLMMTLT